MNDQNTDWEQIEPMMLVPYPNPYEEKIGIPPPPLKPEQKGSKMVRIAFISAFLLF